MTVYVARANQQRVYQSFATPFVTAVLGSRRVGKSTLVRYYAQENLHVSWVFLNMDDREERRRIENTELKNRIEECAKQQIGRSKKIWVAIDEAQKCPALFDQIKLLYDQYKDQEAIKFILTGSGFLELHQLSAESLAGRIEILYLREFNLKETSQLRGVFPLPDSSIFNIIQNDPIDIAGLKKHVDALSPFRPDIESCLAEQCVWGGLPEVLLSKDSAMRRNYLSHYLQTYLERDVRSIATVSDLNLYQKLMEVVAEQTGSVRQDKEIVEALACSRDTLKKYRGFLLATLVYKEVYPFLAKTLHRIVKSPKGYLLNNGLISYLTGIEHLSLLEKTGAIGHRFENWFLKECQIWLDGDSKRGDIYYWRTSGGIEVDFIVSQKPHIFPFEVTYSKRAQEKKVKNLVHFMQKEPQATTGFYIYMGDFHFDQERNIVFIPAWAIC